MAAITPTILNGTATISKRSTPYYVIPINKNFTPPTLGKPKAFSGQTQSGMTLIAGDTWADVVSQLNEIGITQSIPAEPV